MRYATFPHELLTIAQMAEADRLAVEGGVPYLTLMENAGRAVAAEGMKMVPLGGRILVMCGPGNNGGDGFVAARMLRERGYRVQVWLSCKRTALKGAAAEMAAQWGVEIATGDERELFSVDLIIDALFGAGLSRPIEYREITDQFKRICNTLVLSVDVPSGLNGDTGQANGPIVSANRTVTFFRRKIGHMLMPGRAFCGEVVVADIGIPDSVLLKMSNTVRSTAPARWSWLGQLPNPRIDSHKYTRGHAIVVSGPADKTGAARLGARGALRAGAGLVTVASPMDAVAVNAMHLTAIMLEAFESPNGLASVLGDTRRNVALIGPGCGVGRDTRRMVESALRSKAAVVLDADALTSFEAIKIDPNAQPDIDAPRLPPNELPSVPRDLFVMIAARKSGATVLTPHEGEFKRLFGEMPGSKLDRAQAAAKLSGAIVILKGPDTVIADPDGHAAINDNAPPWLATAGSGDVLAGFVTGLLAQGMDPFEAACAAVWLHGECADIFGPGLIAEDLPEMLPKVLAKLRADLRVQ